MSRAASDALARAASEVGRDGRRPRSLGAVLADLDRALHDGEVQARRPIPTGFEALDHAITGGLRPGELMLVGGGQGIGKTTLTLQMARNMAVAGVRVLYVCYEHDERFLLTRLLTMESGEPDDSGREPGIRLRDILARIDEAGRRGDASLEELVHGTPALSHALARTATYADRLLLLRGSGSYTDLPALAAEVVNLRDAEPGTPCALFLDYLQKVPVYPETLNEMERVTRVVEGLKELALSLGLPIVTIVAAEKEGLQAPRLRLHHLRGGSAILYEADIILILNEKHRIVTKQYLTFNAVQAQRLQSWVVCSIEKNRAGRQLIDLEFRKRFEYACFDPTGGPVVETLIDERIERD